jgi:hypothetical protein
MKLLNFRGQQLKKDQFKQNVVHFSNMILVLTLLFFFMKYPPIVT